MAKCSTIFSLALSFCFVVSAQTYLVTDLHGQKIANSATKSVPLLSSTVLSPGDSVGVTDYDWPSNGGGRRFVSKTSNGSYHFYWTFRQDNDLQSRRPYYRYLTPPNTWSAIKPIDTRCGRMGALSQLKDGRAVATAHVNPDTSNARTFSFIYIDSAIGAGRFNTIRMPIAETIDSSDQPLWPNVCVDTSNTIFVTGTQQATKVGWWTCSKDLGVTWSPWKDSLAGNFLDASCWNGGGNEILVTYNNKVAIITVEQRSSTIWYYETVDKGMTWTKDTIFIAQTPDSVEPYVWYSGVYDKNGNLHVAFTVLDSTTNGGGGGAAGSGWRSQIRYWNSSTGKSSIVMSGWWAVRKGPGANHPTVAESNIAIDRTNGYLYCTWTQADNIGDTSQAGWTNLELYGAKSTDNGATWIYHQNITNSRSPNQIAGLCESDVWHSIGATATADVIDIFYMNDRDAGSSVNDFSNCTTNPMLFLKYKVIPTGVKEIENISRNSLRVTMFPNPFRHRIVITLADKKLNLSNGKNPVRLAIFNTTGRLVKETSFKEKYVWDGTNDHGIRLPVGIYLLRLSVNNMNYSSQMILMK
jgi:hypothetical protein